MNRPRNEQISARWVLFGDSGRTEDALGTALSTLGVTALVGVGLVGLSPYAQRFAHAEVERALSGFLAIDAAHAIARVWSKHRQLEAARRRTRTPPGRELVELAAHDVISNHRVHIDVLVDKLPRQRVDAELTLRMNLSGVIATVSSGRVIALQGGDAELTATLTVLGVAVVERRRKLPSSIVLASAVEHSDDQYIRLATAS